jgi:septal ring factor EnvC (AmiA/AmiB activator)
MTDRRTHTFATTDYLKRIEALTDDLEEHIKDNKERHTAYEHWIKEIRNDVHGIRQSLHDMQQHGTMLKELSRERVERAKLMYSVKEKVLGSTVIAVLLFIVGAIGAAMVSWLKTRL